MKYSSTLYSLLLALTMSACVTPAVRQSASFNESDFEPYARKGTSSIVGSAFMKTRGGDVKPGAGSTVELIPATTYTDERFNGTLRGVNWEGRDSRLATYIRQTAGDAQGDFEFHEIPAGDYWLSCYITWEYPTQYGLSTTGGQALTRVSVREGQTLKAVLTR